MKHAARLLPWFTAVLIVTAAGVVFQRQRAQRTLQIQLDQVGVETVRLRQLAKSTKSQREKVAAQVEVAERIATEPALSPVERRQRELAAKLMEIKPLMQQRPLPPLVPASRHGDIFPELLEDPVYARHVQQFYQLQVEVNYGPWLRTLDVAGEARSKVMRLLLEQYLVELDTEEAAVHAGLDPEKNRREVIQLRLSMSQKVLAELQGVLGAATYADFVKYNSTVSGRASFHERFVQRLSYSTEPLTAEQINRIFAATLGPSPVGDRYRLGLATFLNVVIQQAKPEFTPAQWDQLEETVAASAWR